MLLFIQQLLLLPSFARESHTTHVNPLQQDPRLRRSLASGEGHASSGDEQPPPPSSSSRPSELSEPRQKKARYADYEKPVAIKRLADSSDAAVTGGFGMMEEEVDSIADSYFKLKMSGSL